ncbi:uncharacterized protein Bfra_005430 [Botrytis fragariae]|uniref:Uncharacterized protein n=1 Tax=Botrytis fragariae TaxID=1964551 RepID=A0A8H6EIZ1_9HELO|nr:uncharacterized protein Bfra_005430 [Botrytis fragariae]KAF5873963.1 hypothetical protein Bfra_005430 [Botrytis fragariae]
MLSANYTSQCINKTIAKRYLNISTQYRKVSQDVSRGSFNEERFIADEERFAATRRAEVLPELKVLEDNMREVSGFQTATAMEREND